MLYKYYFNNSHQNLVEKDWIGPTRAQDSTVDEWSLLAMAETQQHDTFSRLTSQTQLSVDDVSEGAHPSWLSPRWLAVLLG